MKLRELSKQEYLSTMGKKMIDITNKEVVIVDICEYTDELNKCGLLQEYAYNNGLIESVYVNDSNTYHHVLFFGKEENTYIVVIVDVKECNILGHYLLNISDEYSL